MVEFNPQIDIKRVSNVYTGKPGCMCGCNGNYRYASDWVVEGGLCRGYEVDPEDVSDRSIKIVVGKITKYIEGLTQAQYEAEVKAETIVINEDYVFLHDQRGSERGRYLAVYFKKPEKAAARKAKKAAEDSQKFLESMGG